LAYLKEMSDYYTRVNVTELEGDLRKASRSEDAGKLARIYKKLIITWAVVSEWGKSQAEEISQRLS
jgi:hypothetical protein